MATPEPTLLDLDRLYRHADRNPMRLWVVCQICGSVVDVSMRGEHWWALHGDS